MTVRNFCTVQTMRHLFLLLTVAGAVSGAAVLPVVVNTVNMLRIFPALRISGCSRTHTRSWLTVACAFLLSVPVAVRQRDSQGMGSSECCRHDSDGCIGGGMHCV